MKYILAALMVLSQGVKAQQRGKEDKRITEELRTSINYLSDDKLEGRRTGSPGEKLAFEYIVKSFKNAGLSVVPFGENYIQPFDINEGKEIGKETSLKWAGQTMVLNKDFFPFAFSANVKKLRINNEKDAISYYYVSEVKKENANNPHFDIKDNLINFAKIAGKEGRKLVIVKENPPSEQNKKTKKDGLVIDAKAVAAEPAAEERESSPVKTTIENKEEFLFDSKDKTPSLKIPVIFLKASSIDEQQQSITSAEISNTELTVSVNPKTRTGHNVIGYINNNATNTIILGAHYDHLGYGEDHNSLYAGSTPMIHNGADDNASGTAALIELGKWLKRSSYKKYNYALVAFSGEELGLYGSKYFTEHAGLDMNTVNYMINMDMIGRLNDSTHGLTIGGYGTSPSWGKLINTKDPYFKINADSSGSGPSDHTSFYRKDIPVLFFFTGSHKDYHKPSDDADKINYSGELQVIHYIQNIIAQTDKMDKLVFTKTREVSMGRSTFKVSLGIMPDYTFSGSGVMVDGVSENKAAQKAGIKTGDVLIQLGDHKFTDVQTYMDALNKFNKGESTNVKLLRGKEELILPVTF